MRNSHIAIFNVPAPVHINPTLAIVEALVRRGYRVTYVTSQGFSHQLAALGAEILLVPRFEYPFNQDHGESLPVSQQYSTNFFDLAKRTLALTSEFFERNRPALILHDARALAARVIAARHAVPAIRMGPQLAFDLPNCSHPLVSDAMRARVKMMQDKVTNFLQDLGIDGAATDSFSRASPCIYFYTDDLKLGQHPADSRSIFAGRCAAERFNTVRWRSTCTDGRPSILISASTVYVQGPQYYKTCLDALAGLEWHAILAVGNEVDASALQPLPPHTEIAQSVPQVLIMPYVQMMICLGGMTTTMEAMYHGVPMLMLSNGAPEAEVYAENAQNHGLGVHLKGKAISADSIRSALIKLAEDPVIRARVNAMRRKVIRSAGAEEAVNWLEGFLSAETMTLQAAPASALG